ncbi:DNA mismatch repair endonuclease MutL [Stomatobaculum longum]|uniref:DNA mismatch repair endonuclease MutL n=1 Tax=Stomatobaculum longum TaxID=796942 RepID=UPI0028ED6BA9|nr:DNA mismatch repair endonuclease MutL [Stomatobaculum longum]
MSIQLLDESTINKIAAGEVIERPASIVKELAENAIDADASVITIEIRDGGIAMIRVTDNGSGIAADEVPTAFLRHATSKIRTAEDIHHVQSLGFRGEALASIAAVARIELITKQREALTGVRYTAEGGQQTALEEIGAPAGTTVIARDLFFNTPVRRGFLKAAVTETAHVAALAEELALSHPEVSIRFLANGQSRFHTSGNREVKDIIYQLYGREIATKLLPVEREEKGLSVHGFIGRPEISRGSRALEHYCINGRYIKSPLLSKAIEDGYGDRMMQHNFPFAVLFLTTKPEVVDVNVHPTKREVRFSDGQALYLFLRTAVEEALQRAELIRLSALSEERRTVPDVSRKKAEKPPEPFETKRLQAERQQEEAEKELSLSSFLSAYGQRQLNQSAETERSTNRPEQTEQPLQRGAAEEERAERKEQETGGETERAVAEEKPAFETVERGGQYALFRPEERQHLRLVGAVFDTYWIAERGNSMYLIDQHAAHEKVNYERLLRDYRQQAVSAQRLEPPLLLTLSAEEAALLTEQHECFEKIGFSIEHFGGPSYAVRAVPDILPSVLKEELLKTMFASLLAGQRADDVPLLIIEKTASMSCKAAIKGNQHISQREAEALLDELFALENPYNCPHGRPTIIELTKTELERRFKRIV